MHAIPPLTLVTAAHFGHSALLPFRRSGTDGKMAECRRANSDHENASHYCERTSLRSTLTDARRRTMIVTRYYDSSPNNDPMQNSGRFA
jgi:hypothetical protein